MPKLEFWYDFASTYSYLSAMRIEALADAAGVEIVYRPFLLGPIFRAQGLNTSPFVLNPAKGQYMARDIARIAATRGLSFHVPEPFPAHSVLAARIGTVAEEEGWIAPFTRAVFDAEFAGRANIAAPEILAHAVAGLGRDPAQVLERASSDAVKSALRSRTEAAAGKDIFGAPTFISEDGELFWGDDRLEQALAWAGSAESRSG
jgi:2-hydroxychromene-2-carboxylate isomerase